MPVPADKHVCLQSLCFLYNGENDRDILMVNNEIILILGAGASMDYGFPSGYDLVQDIINCLHGKIFQSKPEFKKAYIALALKRHYEISGDPQPITFCFDKVDKFRNALIQGSPASIDDFIDKNKEEGFAIIGKLCIVLCISMYEKQAEKFFLEKIQLTAKEHRYYDELIHSGYDDYHWEIKEGWYRQLWKKIYEGNNESENLKKVTFITFNYDRSLEYFLYTSFRSMLGMSPEEAAVIFNDNVFIYHVYGQIGYLGWQNQQHIKNDYKKLSIEKFKELVGPYAFMDGGKLKDELTAMDNNRDEDHTKQLDHVLSLAKEIRTYTEATEEPEEIREEIMRRANRAKKVFFLGFGYQPQNLAWLQERINLFKGKIYGTTYRFGKKQLKNTISALKKNFANSSVAIHENDSSSEYKIRDYFLHVQDIE